MTTPYFCWDEHDYIAHNIYHRLILGAFEIPFSNKWPLGHAIIYFLTTGQDPFSIWPYRVATSLVDAFTALFLALLACPGKEANRNRYLAAVLFSAALSVALRSSPGILAENLANPFLALGALCLQNLRSPAKAALFSVPLFACACWVKPTAVFPGLFMVGAYFWGIRKNQKAILVFAGVVFVSLSTSVGVFFFNSLWGSGNLMPSAWEYNLSGSVFRTHPAHEYLDVVFTGVAFFQFLFPWLIFCFFLLVSGDERRRHWLPCLWVCGALASLALRPAGAQTSYWLYTLPPLMCLGWLGYIKISSLFSQKDRAILSCFLLFPIAYGWMVNLAGPALGLQPGGRGGLRQIQTQVADLEPALHALQNHPRYQEKQSRLFLWGMPWQIFYLGRCVPASSLLTSESWTYGIQQKKQRQWIAQGLAKADFVWVDEGPGSDEIRMALTGLFESFYQETGRALYARIHPPLQ